jgi:hypothetical protein
MSENVRQAAKPKRPRTKRPGKVTAAVLRLPKPEIYSPQRKAEFMLTNSVTPAEYQAARRAVRRLGLDPDEIPHERPVER